MKFREFLMTGAAFLSASCASYPQVELDQAGGLPSPATYRFAHLGEELPSALVAGIADELDARGFKHAEQPRYLVQLAGADRPGKSGLFLPEVPPDESGNRSWLSSPARSKSMRTRRMMVSIIDVANGQEVYRIQASEFYRTRLTDDGKDLARAMLAQLPTQ